MAAPSVDRLVVRPRPFGNPAQELEDLRFRVHATASNSGRGAVRTVKVTIDQGFGELALPQYDFESIRFELVPSSVAIAHCLTLRDEGTQDGLEALDATHRRSSQRFGEPGWSVRVT
jgi:hypothetical protein